MIKIEEFEEIISLIRETLTNKIFFFFFFKVHCHLLQKPTENSKKDPPKYDIKKESFVNMFQVSPDSKNDSEEGED